MQIHFFLRRYIEDHVKKPTTQEDLKPQSSENAAQRQLNIFQSLSINNLPLLTVY